MAALFFCHSPKSTQARTLLSLHKHRSHTQMRGMSWWTGRRNHDCSPSRSSALIIIPPPPPTFPSLPFSLPPLLPFSLTHAPDPSYGAGSSPSPWKGGRKARKGCGVGGLLVIGAERRVSMKAVPLVKKQPTIGSSRCSRPRPPASMPPSWTCCALFPVRVGGWAR